MTLTPRNRHGIADFKSGSYIAVKELYDEHYSPLVDFAGQLIINKPEAHHIVQETFIKLFLLRDRFDTEPDIKAFLYITVRNICFAYIKSEKEDETNREPHWYIQALKAVTRHDDENIRKEAICKIHNQVAGLPEPERKVFRSLFCDHLTIPAAAEQLGVTPVSVVQSRIQAIRLLREKLVAVDLFSIPLFIYFVAVSCGEKS
ncbi:RNA polymerase sigma factor [Niastella caeni]|nr:sigma-70 family RNA polymerase sigma factor [Niastella caeni]